MTDTDPVEALQVAETSLYESLQRLIHRTTATITLLPDVPIVKDQHNAACAAMQFAMMGEYEAAQACVRDYLRIPDDLPAEYPNPIGATVKDARDTAVRAVASVLEARTAVAR